MSRICRCFTVRMYPKKHRQAGTSAWRCGIHSVIQPFLEDDLASQLNDSSGTGLCHLAEVCVADSIAYRALARATGRSRRRIDAVLRMVKGVECLQAELETYSFGKLEHLA
jgi:hypothetical protein